MNRTALVVACALTLALPLHAQEADASHASVRQAAGAAEEAGVVLVWSGREARLLALHSAQTQTSSGGAELYLTAKAVAVGDAAGSFRPLSGALETRRARPSQLYVPAPGQGPGDVRFVPLSGTPAAGGPAALVVPAKAIARARAVDMAEEAGPTHHSIGAPGRETLVGTVVELAPGQLGLAVDEQRTFDISEAALFGDGTEKPRSPARRLALPAELARDLTPGSQAVLVGAPKDGALERVTVLESTPAAGDPAPTVGLTGRLPR